MTGGDLTNLRGRVTNVLSDRRVEVMPTQLGLNEALTFDASQLRKFFEVRALAACVTACVSYIYSLSRHAGNSSRIHLGSLMTHCKCMPAVHQILTGKGHPITPSGGAVKCVIVVWHAFQTTVLVSQP